MKRTEEYSGIQNHEKNEDGDSHNVLRQDKKRREVGEHPYNSYEWQDKESIPSRPSKRKS